MSIRKRPSKKNKNGYVFEVYFKYKEYGVSTAYRKSGFITLKEARDHEALKKSELIRTRHVFKPCKKTLKDVYDEFMEIGATEFQHNTLYNTKKTLHHWSGERADIDLGRCMIDEIDYKLLQKYFNLRKSCGISTNSDIKSALRRIFIFAIKCNYIASNPMELVSITGIKHKKPKHILTYEEYCEMIQAFRERNTFWSDAVAIAIQIGYYTGMRLSEVVALHKEDIDFHAYTINIHRKMVYKGLRKKEIYAEERMKTERSEDIIPLANDLAHILIQWFEMNPYDKIICDEEGNYLHPDCLGNVVRNIAKQHGIEFHFHLLRHTYSTMLIKNKVEPKVVQDLMRHVNINTTLSLYTHLEDEEKKATLDSVFKTITAKKCSGVERVSKMAQIKTLS